MAQETTPRSSQQLFNVNSAHTVPEEEKIGFGEYINQLLGHDQDLAKGYLPIDPKSNQIYTKVKDGLLLAKLINAVAPNTIDIKTLKIGPNVSTFNITANLNNVLAAARKIKVQVTNIGAEDIIDGKPHLVLGIIWQILRYGLESQMQKCIDDLGLTGYQGLKNPLEILIRWVNDSISRVGCKRVCKNLTSDISDSEIYGYLLFSMDENIIDPNDVTRLVDKEARAEKILSAADKLGLRSFLAAKDIVNGVQRLNFAFVANLFNHAKHNGPKERAAPAPAPVPAPAPAPAPKDDGLAELVEKLRRENEELKARNAALQGSESEAEALRRRLAELEAANSSNSAETEKLRRQLAQLETDSGSRGVAEEEELVRLRAKLEEAEGEKARLAALEEELAQAREQSEEAEKLRRQMGELSESNTHLQTELQKRERALQKAREEEAESERLKAALADREAQLANLQANEEELKKLKKRLGDNDGEMERLRNQLHETERSAAEKAELEKRLAAAQKAAADLEARMKILLNNDIVQRRAMEEKVDQLVTLPLKQLKEGAIKVGWLTKQGNKHKKQWKKRFFILRDNYMFYYKSDSERKEQKGKWIRLNGAQVDVIGDRGKQKNVFAIIVAYEKAEDPHHKKEEKKAPKRYEAFTHDWEDLEDWVKKLRETIAAIPPDVQVTVDLKPKEVAVKEVASEAKLKDAPAAPKAVNNDDSASSSSMSSSSA